MRHRLTPVGVGPRISELLTLTTFRYFEGSRDLSRASFFCVVCQAAQYKISKITRDQYDSRHGAKRPISSIVAF
jgi:hypothetical protein